MSVHQLDRIAAERPVATASQTGRSAGPAPSARWAVDPLDADEAGDEIVVTSSRRLLRVAVAAADAGASFARGGLPTGVPAGSLVGVALDVETTGLDPRRHEVIELAMQRFRLDAEGRIVETGRARTWLEQPSGPIPTAVTRVTGLADADVAGRTIADGEASCMLLDADFVVAHNASFDRPFVERRLPLAAGRAWACSLSDVDWPAEGFEGRRLAELAGRMGWFFDPHRADADVTALLHVLDHVLDDGVTVAARMLGNARTPSWTVEAVEAPFSAKDLLRARGYRWNAADRLWSAAVADSAVRDEVSWAKAAVYGGRREPVARRITWRERHA